MSEPTNPFAFNLFYEIPLFAFGLTAIPLGILKPFVSWDKRPPFDMPASWAATLLWYLTLNVANA